MVLISTLSIISPLIIFNYLSHPCLERILYLSVVVFSISLLYCIFGILIFFIFSFTLPHASCIELPDCIGTAIKPLIPTVHRESCPSTQQSYKKHLLGISSSSIPSIGTSSGCSFFISLGYGGIERRIAVA